MYLKDVITLLREGLPKHSDKFSEKVAISTITFAGGLVTVVTVTPHGLVTGNMATIVGAMQKTPITSIVRTDTTALITTSIDHDQTLDYADIADQPDITISECSIAAYNGAWVPEDIASRRLLSFEVTGAPADAADGFLLENSPGFSGLKEITMVDATTFTFAATGLAPSGSGGYVHTDIRASGAAFLERILEAYSKESDGNWWAFVTPDDTVASKDRHTVNDSTATPTKGDEFRQKIITPFNIYVLVPSKNDIAGRASYDAVILESVAIYKSVLAASLASPYAIESFSKIVIEGHGVEAFLKAYYVHRFSFSITDEIIIDDTLIPEDSVAFRDIDFDFLNDFDETIMDNTLKTDEE